MITIENRQRRLVHFAIPVAIGGGEVHHIGTTERTQDSATRSSSTSVVAVRRTYPTTITLAAVGTKGSISAPLPNEYAEAPEIAAALKKRLLVRVELPELAPQVEPPPDSAPSGADDTSTPNAGLAPAVE